MPTAIGRARRVFLCFAKSPGKEISAASCSRENPDRSFSTCDTTYHVDHFGRRRGGERTVTAPRSVRVCEKKKTRRRREELASAKVPKARPHARFLLSYSRFLLLRSHSIAVCRGDNRRNRPQSRFTHSCTRKRRRETALTITESGSGAKAIGTRDKKAERNRKRRGKETGERGKRRIRRVPLQGERRKRREMENRREKENSRRRCTIENRNYVYGHNAPGERR